MERVLDVSRKAAVVFGEREFEQPRLEAELLLAGVLGVKRLDLYLQHDRPLTEAELERYRGAVRRRLRREPLQYILGTAAFRNLELHVDPRVLIPRPETELLVGEVLKWATSHAASSVLDIGTGSGAIALSLATEGGFATVVASDASQPALDVARANADRLGIDRVDFRCGSLFDVVRPGETFDVIVSNPPYVGEAERATLAPEVVAHEPEAALFAGADGLAVLRRIIAGAARHLNDGGLLALEIGAGQEQGVLDLIDDTHAFADARVLADLSGRPRMALAGRG